jgi:sec-independent protein translocase protein TatB
VFDVGFSELVLCFVVALVVLGPEKLPAVARALGRWTGQARAYVRSLNAQLEREAGAAELKRDLTDAARAIRDGAQSVRDEARKVADPAAKPGDRGP